MPSNAKMRSILNAGLSSLEAVLRPVLRDGRPADRILSSHFRQHREYGGRDRRFISETVFATLRWWGWLRHLECCPETRLIEDDSDVPRQDLARLALAAVLLDNQSLRPELWEAFCTLTAAPPARVESIRMKATASERLKSLWTLFATPVKHPPSWRDLMPAWVLPEVTITSQHDRLIDYLQRRPPLWLRCRPNAVRPVIAELTEKTGIAPRPHHTIPCALQIRQSRVSLYETDGYRRGQYEVQDLASQAAGMVCAPRPGERWWDACAGGGGKTLLLAEMMERKGTMVASDIREYKLKDLRRRARRAELPNVETKPWDGKSVRSRKATFDGVLVDAPCTCSGTWRRNPDGRWTTRPEEPAEMAALQLEILQAAATAVKPGGTLVYITCSMFGVENEGVVNAFTQKNDQFELQSFAHPLTGDRCQGMLAIRPWEGDCDILFAARWQKNQLES
ncbi:MAG: RsmB/NOP family class I SAM-dependent RNA methyltransferase [bacterium]